MLFCRHYFFFFNEHIIYLRGPIGSFVRCYSIWAIIYHRLNYLGKKINKNYFKIIIALKYTWNVNSEDSWLSFFLKQKISSCFYLTDRVLNNLRADSMNSALDKVCLPASISIKSGPSTSIAGRSIRVISIRWASIKPSLSPSITSNIYDKADIVTEFISLCEIGSVGGLESNAYYSANSWSFWTLVYAKTWEWLYNDWNVSLERFCSGGRPYI